MRQSSAAPVRAFVAGREGSPFAARISELGDGMREGGVGDFSFAGAFRIVETSMRDMGADSGDLSAVVVAVVFSMFSWLLLRGSDDDDVLLTTSSVITAVGDSVGAGSCC